MNLYTALISRLIFPLQERLKRHDTVRVRQAYEDSQWWGPEVLAQYQLSRLRRFLEAARTHVPYYRDRFAQLHFDPATVTGLAELARLPFLTKADIRANLDRLKADHAHDLARFNTGGSSGEPLIFYIGKERVAHDVAAKWRATRWWGVDIGDPEIVVWGSPIELHAQDRMRAWRDRLMRTTLLPAFDMSPSMLDRYVTAIRKARPRMVFGYPSSIAFIARHARSAGQRLDDLGVKVVFVTSERLYDDQRTLIEQTFACPVANGYGGRDAGFIAHQCPAGSMHITAEDIIVEIIGPDGMPLPSGAAGEIVVTHLATRDFPFIRYRTGDIGALDDRPCACGRGLPVLKSIQGRTTDFVMAQDGTVMHGLALIYIVRDLTGVREFKIIQERVDQIRVLLSTNDQFDEGDTDTIVRGFRARLGSGVQVDIERVAEVPKEASGKFRYIVSHVPGMHGGTPA